MAQNDTTPPSAIVLNRMYVGDYLASNLGHEVINLYQADNGGNYIYLNSTGDFVKAHQNKVGYMLFVKYHGISEVEVIGMAKGLHDVYQADQKFTDKYNGACEAILNKQHRFAADEGGIKYGGVSIFDIFSEEEQQSVFFTYKADEVYIPREGKRLFIRFHDEDNSRILPPHESSDIVVVLEGHQQAKASLKQYLYAEGTYAGDLAKKRVEEKQRDYQKVRKELIEESSLWVSSSNKVDEEELGEINQRKVSLFDICQLQNDENRISNALAYFMLRKRYRSLWRDFFALHDIDLGEPYTITREESAKIESNKRLESGGRIDLMIRTKQSLIVIENKIKSDINSVEEDGDGKQLLRYYNYAHWLAGNKESKDYGKVCKFVILTPKYNIPTISHEKMQKEYRIITYADLYAFLSARKDEFTDDDNFVALYDVMHRHTHENVNDYLYHEMQEKFFRRIREKL